MININSLLKDSDSMESAKNFLFEIMNENFTERNGILIHRNKDKINFVLYEKIENSIEKKDFHDLRSLFFYVIKKIAGMEALIMAKVAITKKMANDYQQKITGVLKDGESIMIADGKISMPEAEFEFELIKNLDISLLVKSTDTIKSIPESLTPFD
jgi:hypothetical protein